MSTVRWRHRLRPLTLVPLGILLAGCGPAATTGGTAAPSTAPPQAAESSAATGPITTVGPGTPASSAALPATGQRCHTSRLRAAVTRDPSGGAAGSYALRVVFTNTGASTCTMDGYPGVSFLTGPGGQQVNRPAQRGSGTPATLRLAPGGSAHALLLMVQTGNYPGGTCHPVTIGGLRIYPPGETTPLYAASSQQVCSAAGTGLATVYPVTS